MPDSEREYGLFRTTEAQRPFDNLVALHVRCLGNRLEKRFPLGLLLEVEEHQLLVRIRPRLLKRIGDRLGGGSETLEGGVKLRIRLRHCYIRYHSDQIDILAHTKYESPISIGKFELRTSAKVQKRANSRAGVEVQAELAAKTAGVTGQFGAQAGAGISRATAHTVEATSVISPEVYEVRAVPNGWRVGDPEYGDPVGPSNCLDGRYFDQPVKGFSQTCEAECRDGFDEGKLTFTVTVRDGLHVERISGHEATKMETSAAVMAMRDRIASIRLERHLSKQHSVEQDNEIPLMTVTCIVARGAQQPASADRQHTHTKPKSPKTCSQSLVLPGKRKTHRQTR